MTKRQLKAYCEAEFENIDAVVFELFTVIDAKKEYSTADLAAAATFIHNFYNGIENILKRILLFNKIEVEDSPTWHKNLLKTASEKQIISEKIYENLLGYLSFRHFFVHAYCFNLRWEEMKPLVDNLEETLKELKLCIKI